jgi:catechol 2,3-dioxygenase-like lactoylglutathione lyase family enzyme
MENIIAKLLQDFEQGKMSRRQLIQSIAVTATAASAASAAPAATGGNSVMKAIYLNHNSYQVADYAKTRDWYADLFGMTVEEDDGKQCRLAFGNNLIVARTRPSGTPRVDHVAYTIENWDQKKEAIAAELKRRNIPIKSGDTKTSLHILDPDGFEVQFGGLRQ